MQRVARSSFLVVLLLIIACQAAFANTGVQFFLLPLQVNIAAFILLGILGALENREAGWKMIIWGFVPWLLPAYLLGALFHTHEFMHVIVFMLIYFLPSSPSARTAKTG